MDSFGKLGNGRKAAHTCAALNHLSTPSVAAAIAAGLAKRSASTDGPIDSLGKPGNREISNESIMSSEE